MKKTLLKRNRPVPRLILFAVNRRTIAEKRQRQETKRLWFIVRDRRHTSFEYKTLTTTLKRIVRNYCENLLRKNKHKLKASYDLLYTVSIVAANNTVVTNNV